MNLIRIFCSIILQCICCLLTMLECFAKQRTIKLLVRKTFSASFQFVCRVFSLWTHAYEKKATREKPYNKGAEQQSLVREQTKRIQRKKKKKKKNEVQQKSLQLKYKSKCIDFYGLPFIQLSDLFGFSFTNTHTYTATHTLCLSCREFIVYFIKSSFARS